MRKQALLFCYLVFFLGVCSYGQEGRGIAVSFTPYGKTVLGNSSTKTDSLVAHLSPTSPVFQLSYEKHTSFLFDVLWELSYSKMKFKSPIESTHLSADNISLFLFEGITFFGGQRLQLPVYIGLGASYYPQLKKDGLFIDLGVRTRLKLYVTNQIAVFGGAYYYMGFGNNDLMESHSGIESGLLYSF